jgi:hypothetical protein
MAVYKQAAKWFNDYGRNEQLEVQAKGLEVPLGDEPYQKVKRQLNWAAISRLVDMEQPTEYLQKMLMYQYKLGGDGSNRPEWLDTEFGRIGMPMKKKQQQTSL